MCGGYEYILMKLHLINESLYQDNEFYEEIRHYWIQANAAQT
jgi:hypothetical protein